MTNPSEAPSTQSMVRDQDQTKTTEVVIDTLKEKYFEEVRTIWNNFIGNGKGLCCGMCPYRWCPTPKDDFESIYRKSQDRCDTFGVAVRQEDQVVLGYIKLRLSTQLCTDEENFVHTVKPGELYIDNLAVLKEARGKGVGTKLLNWAEEMAKQRKANRITLSVLKGNPALNLYKRFGLEVVGNSIVSGFCSCLIMGLGPAGRFGVLDMEKKVST